MNQAAELYLIQIIEKGSLVGMVTFESFAKIQNYLTKITDDNAYQKITVNLPQVAGGGTSICSGLREGFQVKQKCFPKYHLPLTIAFSFVQLSLNIGH